MSDAADADGPDPFSKEKIESAEYPAAVQTYPDRRVKARFSKRTYYNRRQSYRHFQLFCEMEGTDFFDTVSESILGDFIDVQLNHGYSKGTVENRVYDLSALFDYLIPRNNPVDENPIAPDDFDMDAVRSNSDYGNIQYIEVEDYNRLLDEIDEHRIIHP